jgi:hypothetical protein
MQTIGYDSLQDKFNNNPAAINLTDFRSAFEILLVDIPPIAGKGTGVLAQANVGLSVRMGNYGASVLGLGYKGAHPVINLSASNGVALSDDMIQVALLALGGDYVDHTATGTGDLSPEGDALTAQLMTDYGISIQSASTFVWLAETTTNPKGDGVDFTDPTTVSIFLATAEATFGNDATPGTFDVMLDNASGADIGFVEIQELAVTLSRHFMDEQLVLGVNLKGVKADASVTHIYVGSLEEGEQVKEEADEWEMSTLSDSRLGVDVGALYQINETFRVGMTVRNLNQPKFAFDGGYDYTMRSQVRAGLLWQPLEMISVAVDLDLFANESEVIDGLDVQFLATGIEWAPIPWFALRAGMYQNIAADEEMVTTLGLGLRLGIVTLDVAQALGPDVKIESAEVGDSESFPERTSLMATLGLRFDF